MLKDHPSNNYNYIVWLNYKSLYSLISDKIPTVPLPRPKMIHRLMLWSTPGTRLFTSASTPPTTRSLPLFTPLISKSTFFTQPYKAANILGSLHNFKDSYGKVIRRGRGPSSGKGKTSGRGHKGQGQHGGVPEGMNGGQTPDHIVAGPYGFKNM